MHTDDHNRPGKVRGFSLVELMIVVVIIGVLAAIAYPSYRTYVRKSKRADAHAALTEMAAREERFYSNASPPIYSNSVASLGYPNPAISPDGYWTVTIPAADATSFSLTATAGGTKGHTDPDCTTITLDSAGVKGGASADCW